MTTSSRLTEFIIKRNNDIICAANNICGRCSIKCYNLQVKPHGSLLAVCPKCYKDLCEEFLDHVLDQQMWEEEYGW